MTAYLGFLEDGAFARDHDRQRPVLERSCGVDWGTVRGRSRGGSFGLWSQERGRAEFRAGRVTQSPSPVQEALQAAQRNAAPELTRGLTFSRWVVSTVVPSVTGPASAFFRLSFTSTMLSSRSTRLRSSTLHSSSISFSFSSRLAAAPLSAERSQSAAGNKQPFSQKPHQGEGRIRTRSAGTGPQVAPDHRSGSNTQGWDGPLGDGRPPSPGPVSALHKGWGGPRRALSSQEGLNLSPKSLLVERLSVVSIPAIVTATPKGQRSFINDPWRMAGPLQPAPHGSLHPSGTCAASLGLVEQWSSALAPSQPCFMLPSSPWSSQVGPTAPRNDDL